MKSIGYGEQYVKRYKMFSTFYQKRLPFIIIVAGTECMGKSTLVTQLGDRINISNIVQTSIVHKVMSGLQAIMQSNKAVS
jgi:2-phosphoglycerate kinase